MFEMLHIIHMKPTNLLYDMDTCSSWSIDGISVP
jgi:hypothetical protein